MQIYDIPIDSSRRETTAHGTFDFPMAVYETVLRRNILGFVSWHWHREFQFCLVTAGTVTFWVQGQQLVLSEGQGLFINSNVLHMAKPETPDAAYCCIDILPSLLCGFPGSVLDVSLITPLSADASVPLFLFSGETPESREALALLERIHQLSHRKTTGYPLMVTGLLMELLGRMLSMLDTAPAAPKEDMSRLRSVLQFIDQHYAEHITLSQCADLAGLSSSEFCRQFKRVMHCTLTTYIRQVRLQKSAAELLLHPEKSVSQIAYETGFSTTSYFISQFRAATGMTPGAYRQTKRDTGKPAD